MNKFEQALLYNDSSIQELFRITFEGDNHCNSLLYGISGHQLLKIQRIQNTAARLILQRDDEECYGHVKRVTRATDKKTNEI